MESTLPVIIAGFPGLSVSVPYRKDEPMQRTLDRVTSELANTAYGDTQGYRKLYVDGIEIDDYTKSMEYYNLFGRVVTYKLASRQETPSVSFSKQAAPKEQVREPKKLRTKFIKAPKMFVMVIQRRRKRQKKPVLEEAVVSKPLAPGVKVVTERDEILKIDISEGETVEQLKAKLMNKTDTKLSAEQLCLFFDGSKLDDELTLSDYNIQSNATIHLLVARHVDTPATSVFVKTLDGKTIVCRIQMDQSIQKLKDIIHHKQGIPPEQQSLTFEGKPLAQDTSPLKDYYIKNNDTVNLTIRLMGGSFEPYTPFADVSDISGRQKLTLVSNPKSGRYCSPGTNIEVRCKCTSTHRVISEQKFGLYELGDTPVKCPVCKGTEGKPETVGFYKCQYRIHGLKADGTHYRSDWFRVTEKDQYQLYDPSKQTSWNRLGIESKSLSASTSDPCTICLEDVSTITTLPCGHQFHTKCISGWDMTCPNCRAARL